jgi:hypothetical protein
MMLSFQGFLKEIALAFSGQCQKEELCPVSGDPVAALPVIFASLAVLVRPGFWRYFHTTGVGAYALTPEAWAEILSAAKAAPNQLQGDDGVSGNGD